MTRLTMCVLGFVTVAGLLVCVQAAMHTQRIPSTTPPDLGQCEPITSLLPTCLNVGWQNATFPNLRGHTNQEEAYEELKDFDELIVTKCSNKLVHFLCAVYAPVCISDPGEDSSDGPITLQPCRSLCEDVLADCGSLLPDSMGYDYDWLAHFDCENFSSDACLNVSDSVTIPDIPGLVPTCPPAGTLMPPIPGTCEPISSSNPICINVGWDSTGLPNLRGHSTQEEAYKELDDFIPLIESQCSNKLVHLLCTVYAPICLQDDPRYPQKMTVLAPCRELCEYVRSTCESVMNRANFSWPQHLDCDNFPLSCSGTCVDVPDNVTLPDTSGMNISDTPTTVYVNTSSPNTSTIEEGSNETIAIIQPTQSTATCAPITDPNPICINVGWNNTSFPNLRGHSTQEEAYQELSDFIPLIEQQCSNKIVHLLCAVYTPFCFQSKVSPMDPHYKITTLGPCRELCEYVHPRCEPVMIGAGYPWPKHLDCDQFPSNSTSQGMCVDVPDDVMVPNIPGLNFSNINTSSPNDSIMQEPSNETIITVQPTHSTATCAPITDAIPICINVGWNNASFPNFRGHITQEEAYEELDDFVPLIEQQCSNKLVHLLCAVYAPVCVKGASQDDNSLTVLEPCNQLCEDVRANCEPVLETYDILWPLDCNSFSKTTGECFNVPDNVTIPHIPGLDVATQPTSTTTHGFSGSGESTSASVTASPDQPSSTDVSTSCQAISPSALTCRNHGRDFACFPNIRGHETQEEATAELREFAPLIERQCSNRTMDLLCAIYFPQCSPNERCLGHLGPCKELCEEVRSDCASVIQSNVDWSLVLDCSDYTSIARGQCIDADREEVVGPDSSSAPSLASVGLLSLLPSLFAFLSITVEMEFL